MQPLTQAPMPSPAAATQSDQEPGATQDSDLTQAQGASSVPFTQMTQTFSDDDEFYLLFDFSYEGPGVNWQLDPDKKLTPKDIKEINTLLPGIFSEFEKPEDLLTAGPLKYQPLAKLFRNNETIEQILYKFGLAAVKMTYGHYRRGCYRECDDSDYYNKSIELDDKANQALMESEKCVSQIRAILFDPDMNNDDKIYWLQSIFSATDDHSEYLTPGQLSEHMDSLFEERFKRLQAAAVEHGFKLKEDPMDTAAFEAAGQNTSVDSDARPPEQASPVIFWPPIFP